MCVCTKEERREERDGEKEKQDEKGTKKSWDLFRAHWIGFWLVCSFSLCFILFFICLLCFLATGVTQSPKVVPHDTVHSFYVRMQRDHILPPISVADILIMVAVRTSFLQLALVLNAKYYFAAWQSFLICSYFALSLSTLRFLFYTPSPKTSPWLITTIFGKDPIL